MAPAAFNESFNWFCFEQVNIQLQLAISEAETMDGMSVYDQKRSSSSTPPYSMASLFTKWLRT